MSRHTSPDKARAFTDNLNHNNRLYRESEVMLRVGHDQRHLRQNEGLAGVIYQDVHHPLCYCEEHQSKQYTAEQSEVARRFPLIKEYSKIKQIPTS